MVLCCSVLGGMFVKGAVAAPDMTAREAQPEMNPATAHLETLLAPLRCLRLHRMELRNVSTAGCHETLLINRIHLTHLLPSLIEPVQIHTWPRLAVSGKTPLTYQQLLIH